jgi:cbb3-type cytochrome oxidase subunit 3
MVSEFFTSIAQASWIPAAMLVLAIISFAAVVFWVFRLDKRVVNEMARLPLDSSDAVKHEGDDPHV